VTSTGLHHDSTRHQVPVSHCNQHIGVQLHPLSAQNTPAQHAASPPPAAPTCSEDTSHMTVASTSASAPPAVTLPGGLPTSFSTHPVPQCWGFVYDKDYTTTARATQRRGHTAANTQRCSCDRSVHLHTTHRHHLPAAKTPPALQLHPRLHQPHPLCPCQAGCPRHHQTTRCYHGEGSACRGCCLLPPLPLVALKAALELRVRWRGGGEPAG
jgi:hypothetical protein